MSFLTLLFLVLLGIAFGSFLNVVVLRYNPERRFFSYRYLKGRSHCPNCQKTLSWYELIPIFSFIFQLGKCRGCSKKISWQYPIVEILCGIVFPVVTMVIWKIFFTVLVGANVWLLWSVASIWILIILSLICVFLVDLKYYIIPNGLNLFIFFLGLLWTAIGWRMGLFNFFTQGSFLNEFAPLFPMFVNPVFNHLIGMVIAVLFFFAIVFLSGGKAMGMGDVKLIAGLGLLFGWPDVIVITFLSFIIGAIFSLGLMALGKKHLRDKVPFGPFIVIATLVVFFFGSGLISSYFGIMGM